MATHIIASALPPKKVVDYNKYRMVKPAWVMDSIKAGKLLPWSDYRVIDESPRQKTIKFDGGKMFSQTTQQSPLRYREQTQNSFYNSQFGGGANTPSATMAGTRVESPLATVESIQATDMMDQNSPPLKKELDVYKYDPSSPENGVSIGGDMNLDQVDSGGEPPRHPDPEKHGGDESPAKARPMTSEEHNARLLTDPRIRKSSTANPNFLKQFYSESRLHHLSTWKAELKSKMQKLAAEKGPVSKPVRRKPGSRQYVMHVDFDSFFCAVSIKKHPEYADKPTAVAHSTGSGSEIASCNYPARKFGVKNGMWMKRAHELCPDLQTLPYDFPAYEEASGLFYEAILQVGGITQSVSIDEALVDITSIVLSSVGSEGVGVDEGSIWREQGKANQIAKDLRQRIKDSTGCNVSVGVGSNILLAKVALRKAKPAGQHQILPEEVLDVLGELRVDDLPGVAYSIGGKLQEIGVKLVKDVRQTSKERLISVLGPKTGERLWEYSRGIDRTEVGEQSIRKSVSAEVNWGIRFISQQEAEDFVRDLSKELERRLLNEGVKGKNLTMKIMRRAMDAPIDPPKHLGHGKCDTFNKSVAFGVATNSGEMIGKEAVTILRSYKFSPGDLRGLGVQLTKLEPLKATTAHPDGSQRRLNFGGFSTGSSAKKLKTEGIEDGDSFDEPSITARGEDDPIADDPLTPRKPKVHPALALAKAGEADANSRTPLNLTGTQFVMPSNPDPAVLAELPPDIRSRLTGKFPKKPTKAAREASPSTISRARSPALQDEIPPDVDPEVFNALPDDMKAEVLASYSHRRGQTLLPQSPRRDRTIRQPKKATTPPKRGIRGMFNRAKERHHDAEAGLQQTSFMTGNEAANSNADAVDELDPEFLSELPEDVRQEVIEDHRRQRLAQKSRLSIQAPLQRRAALGNGEDAVSGGQTKLQFPAKPPKIKFSSSLLTSPTDVKDMLSAWHKETQNEGPHRDDVAVFEKYLTKVIVEERDMDKARTFVVWLRWIVEEGNEGIGKQGWMEAMDSVKDTVQEAMKKRRLAPMDL